MNNLINRWFLRLDDLRAHGRVILLGVAVALLFVPALVTGWRGQQMAAADADSEGFLLGAAAAWCRPEDVLPQLLEQGVLVGGRADEVVIPALGWTGSTFSGKWMEAERNRLAYAMSEIQNWRDDGEPCPETRSSLEPSFATYGEARNNLTWRCLSDKPGETGESPQLSVQVDYSVSTHRFDHQCERFHLARNTFRGIAIAASLTLVGLTIFGYKHSSPRAKSRTG